MVEAVQVAGVCHVVYAAIFFFFEFELVYAALRTLAV
jgi:hypothetical protein